MTKENEIYLEMDAKTVGISIYSNVEHEMLKSKNGEVILFKNLQQAKMYAEQTRKLKNPLDYSIYINIGESCIEYEDFDFVKGYYQLYANDNDIYYIKPADKISVDTLGYIIFNDNERIEDGNEGRRIAKENFSMIREAANNMVKYPNNDCAIQAVGRQWSNMTIKAKNCSGIINVLYNSQIMNINQNRINLGLNAFRFDKEMDKFNTLYFFIQKEHLEPYYFESVKICESILKQIVEEVKKKNPSVKLKTFHLKYPLEIDNDAMVKSHAVRKEDRKNGKSDTSES